MRNTNSFPSSSAPDTAGGLQLPDSSAAASLRATAASTSAVRLSTTTYSQRKTVSSRDRASLTSHHSSWYRRRCVATPSTAHAFPANRTNWRGRTWRAPHINFRSRIIVTTAREPWQVESRGLRDWMRLGLSHLLSRRTAPSTTPAASTAATPSEYVILPPPLILILKRRRRGFHFCSSALPFTQLPPLYAISLKREQMLSEFNSFQLSRLLFCSSGLPLALVGVGHSFTLIRFNETGGRRGRGELSLKH